MSLEQALLSKLPSGLVPSNVGNYYDVAWPFTYTVTFDFGTNPTYGPNTRQTQSFQNTQEAAFILSAICRNAESYTTSGEKSPLQLEIRDRQSTRQFNDRPIPLQAIPRNTPYQIYEIPLVLMPNAFVDLIMTSWQTANQATVGSGVHKVQLLGYRTRTGDIGKVLSTIFGK